MKNSRAMTGLSKTLTRDVSVSTALAYQNPITVLALREYGERELAGAVYVFAMNPNRVRFERAARVAVQQGRDGYLVTQAGLGAPRFTLAGNFGWRYKKVKLPKLLKAKNRSPLLSDFANPSASFARSDLRWTDYLGDYESQGSSTHPSSNVVAQQLDGRQAWLALRDFVGYYFEENQRRMSRGTRPFEMVWIDTLHALKWIVVPTALPNLERTVATQGLHPYTLELIGVYNDLLPRPVAPFTVEDLTGYGYNFAAGGELFGPPAPEPQKTEEPLDIPSAGGRELEWDGSGPPPPIRYHLGRPMEGEGRIPVGDLNPAGNPFAFLDPALPPSTVVIPLIPVPGQPVDPRGPLYSNPMTPANPLVAYLPPDPAFPPSTVDLPLIALPGQRVNPYGPLYPDRAIPNAQVGTPRPATTPARPPGKSVFTPTAGVRVPLLGGPNAQIGPRPYENSTLLGGPNAQIGPAPRPVRRSTLLGGPNAQIGPRPVQSSPFSAYLPPPAPSAPTPTGPVRRSGDPLLDPRGPLFQNFAPLPMPGYKVAP